MSQDKTFPLRLRIPIEWKTRLDKEAKNIGIKELREGRTGGANQMVRMILAAWLEVKFPPDPHDEQSEKYRQNRVKEWLNKEEGCSVEAGRPSMSLYDIP